MMGLSHDLPLARYYALRAGEYGSIYSKPERQDDLRRLGAMLAELLAERDVLEVACGTGFWTQRLAATAGRITATDLSDEMLAIARQRLSGCARVRFAQADAFDLAGLESGYSGALAAFWWSHLRKSIVGRFLDELHARLSPGARVVFADNLYVEGSNTAISRGDDEGNTYQLRRLADGSEHEVLKNFPTEVEFRGAVADRGQQVRFERLTYFWCGSYQLP